MNGELKRVDVSDEGNMRRLLWGVVALIALSPALRAGQLPAANVPASVMKAYHAKFAGRRVVEWKLKGDHNYEAEFKLNGVDIAAKFSPAGKWVETETTIATAELPKEVVTAVARDFKGYQIIETQRLEDVDHRVLLEVHLENAKEILKTQFEPGGKLVSRSAKPKTR
jgi:Putative beta-lactamase-inhibitor-like, PepSY-like